VRRLGIVARGDRGGLGNTTRELTLHVEPARVVCLDLGERNRGRFRPRPGWEVVPWPSREATLALRNLVAACDVVYTAETTYEQDLAAWARDLGTDLVAHVMPELYDAAALDGARLLVPTTWERRRVPDAMLLPVPVATERIPRRDVGKFARLTFAHVASPAMEDRDGTRIVLEALGHVEEECAVLVYADRAPASHVVGNVGLQWRGRTRRYEDLWKHGDALLLPRRYGGLSLPVQEAAAAGMPSVMIDVPPASGWDHVLGIPSSGHRRVRMKGGTFAVHDAAPRALAAVMDRLSRDRDLLARLALAARAHASRISWAALAPAYRSTLSG